LHRHVFELLRMRFFFKTPRLTLAQKERQKFPTRRLGEPRYFFFFIIQKNFDFFRHTPVLPIAVLIFELYLLSIFR
jgi:hypothetical protein